MTRRVADKVADLLSDLTWQELTALSIALWGVLLCPFI